MSIHLFLKGLIIGFSIAAPVGPIGILCIRRTLADGRLAGFISGLGAATADAFYGCVAGFGLTFISNFLIRQQFGFRLIGGGFLCYLGIKTLLARPAAEEASTRGNGLAAGYASTLFLTLTNPMTIISFAAVFAGLGLGETGGDYLAAGFLVAGVFLGSAIWWLALSGGVAIFRDRFSERHLRWVNRLAGIIIITFGLAAFWSLL
jgi:threonine/homoserine/homoserine lactone efflux protein